MTVTETCVPFACAGDALVGVLSRPDAPCDTGVVIVVGGPQYRAGAHRQFVLLARQLAAAGFPVLRFDCRGMGDGAGEPRDFESTGDDIAAAIGALQQHLPALRRIVLWGLCDGASAALLYLHDTPDPRVHGLCLANPWVRSEASLARTHVKHYYLQRLASGEFWRKLLRGGLSAGAVAELAGKLWASAVPAGGRRSPAAALPYQERMARAWATFPGPILLLLSGRDYTAKEFIDSAAAHPAWRDNLARPTVTRLDLAEADHTFSSTPARRQAEEATVAWLSRLAASSAARAPAAATPAAPQYASTP